MTRPAPRPRDHRAPLQTAALRTPYFRSRRPGCRVIPEPARRPRSAGRPMSGPLDVPEDGASHKGVMIDPRHDGCPPQPPTVAAPRRSSTGAGRSAGPRIRIAHQEKVLLARALDVLASDGTAEERLAGLLRLLARTVGARRVAVLADGIERRAAVAIDAEEDPAEAEEPRRLARRQRAPIARPSGQPPGLRRSRSSSAADSRRGPDRRAELADDVPGRPPYAEAAARRRSRTWRRPQPMPSRRPSCRHFAILPIPTAGDVALGFEFGRPVDAAPPGRSPAADDGPPRCRRPVARHEPARGTSASSPTLRARDAERTTFVSTVAHELRTPLTGLRGYLELILGGQVEDPSVEHDFLERSRSIVGSMTELVGDLLELSRLESGTLDLEIGPFSIAEAGAQVAVEPAADRDRPRHPPDDVAAAAAAGRDRRPPPGRADPDEPRRERPEVHAGRAAASRSRAGSTASVAIIVVRDDGDGHPGRRPRPHLRAVPAAAPATSGSPAPGLGLPIARDLARRMGGDLDVASVPGLRLRVRPRPAGSGRGRARGRIDAVPRSGRSRAEEVRLEERVVRPGDRRAVGPQARRRDDRRQVDGTATGARGCGALPTSASEPDRPGPPRPWRLDRPVLPTGYPQLRAHRGFVDNRIDSRRRGRLTSGIRTDRLGNVAGEGHGETRPRTGPAAEDRDPSPRCDIRRRRERTPDGPHRHNRQEGCLDRPPDPLPTRVDSLPALPPRTTLPSRPASRRSGSRLERCAGGDRWSRPAAARLERRHQPDRDPRPGRDRRPPRHRQPHRRPAPRARDGSTGIRRPRQWRRLSGHSAGRGPASRPRPARRVVGKKARFLETVVTADRPWRPRVGSRRSARRRSRRTLRHRGRWPAVTARAVGAARRADRAGLPAAASPAACSSPGRAAIPATPPGSAASLRRPAGRSRIGDGRSRSGRPWPSSRAVATAGRRRRSPITGSSSSSAARPDRSDLAARPGRPERRPGNGRSGGSVRDRLRGCAFAVLSDIHANLVALEAVLAAHRVGRRRLAPRRRRRLRPRAGRGRRAPRRARRDRRRAATTIGPRSADARSSGSTRTPGRRWSGPAAGSRRRPATGCAACPKPARRADTFPRPRQPARPDLGVRHHPSSVARANLDGADDPRRAVRPHPPADGLDPDGRPGRRPAARRGADDHASTDRADARSTRAASASRGRRPAGELAGARHGGRDRHLAPGRVRHRRPSRRRCATPGCRCVSPSDSSTASEPMRHPS